MENAINKAFRMLKLDILNKNLFKISGSKVLLVLKVKTFKN